MYFKLTEHLRPFIRSRHGGSPNAFWLGWAIVFLLSYGPTGHAQDCVSLTITASPSLTLATGTTGKLTVSGADSYTWSTGAHSTTITANSGSVVNITVNVSDDPGQGYDVKPANNVYARIISGL